MPANSLTARVMERINRLRGIDGEVDEERDAGVEGVGARLPVISLQYLAPVAAADQEAAAVSLPPTLKTTTSTLLHAQSANERFGIKLAFLPKIATGVPTTTQHYAKLQTDFNVRVRAARIAANMRYFEVLQYGPGGRDSIIGRAVEQRREWEAGCAEWALFPGKQFWLCVLFVVRFFCGLCGN